MKVTKNLQHGYLFLFIGMGILFLISLTIEIYLTKGDEIQEFKDQISEEVVAEEKQKKEDIEIVINKPQTFDPTYDDNIKFEGYLTDKADLYINDEKVETYRLLGNREYFDFERSLEYGLNRFILRAIDSVGVESINEIEVERLRNDFAVVDSNIDCATNQEDFKYGEVIEFKCSREKLSEDTKISITICWDSGAEIFELNREGDFYFGDTVIQEQNETKVKTFINLSNENITAKTNFTFDVNTR